MIISKPTDHPWLGVGGVARPASATLREPQAAPAAVEPRSTPSVVTLRLLSALRYTPAGAAKGYSEERDVGGT